MSIVEWLRPVAAQSPARRRKVRRLGVELLEERCVLTPVVTVLPIVPQEGALFSGPVATFTDPAPGQAVWAGTRGLRSALVRVTPGKTGLIMSASPILI